MGALRIGVLALIGAHAVGVNCVLSQGALLG
jgi:hypothetical protein